MIILPPNGQQYLQGYELKNVSRDLCISGGSESGFTCLDSLFLEEVLRSRNLTFKAVFETSRGLWARGWTVKGSPGLTPLPFAIVVMITAFFVYFMCLVVLGLVDCFIGFWNDPFCRCIVQLIRRGCVEDDDEPGSDDEDQGEGYGGPGRDQER